ncbi:hypothetical protein CP10881SC42_0812 [Chlamydia avium]|uniref:Uncharacterized protein n=1 Tax=Chlamydia avium TaxID=1457141 RepID=A0ABP2X6M8_9CHLA|nr:hypothetical protein CP10881SC42_0812 [Chlamydia avium]
MRFFQKLQHRSGDKIPSLTYFTSPAPQKEAGFPLFSFIFFEN